MHGSEQIFNRVDPNKDRVNGKIGQNRESCRHDYLVNQSTRYDTAPMLHIYDIMCVLTFMHIKFHIQ